MNCSTPLTQKKPFFGCVYLCVRAFGCVYFVSRMPVKRKALCMEQTPRIFGAAEEELPAIEASFAQDGFVVLQVFSEAECRALIVEQVFASLSMSTR